MLDSLKLNRPLIHCINRLEEHEQGHIVADGIELTSELRRIDEVRREGRDRRSHSRARPSEDGRTDSCRLFQIIVQADESHGLIFAKREQGMIASHNGLNPAGECAFQNAIVRVVLYDS